MADDSINPNNQSNVNPSSSTATNITKVDIVDPSVQNDTEKKLDNMSRDTAGFAISMQKFSKSMRLLYSTQAIGTQEEAAVKFRKIRDETRNDAKVYIEQILPLSQNFLSALKQFFENYEVFNYTEWEEYLEDIIEDTNNNLAVANSLVAIHDQFLICLKKREDLAHIELAEITDLGEKLDETSKQYKEAENMWSWITWGASFVPLPPVESFLKLIFIRKVVQSTAAEKNAKICEAARETVRETLIPALKDFIKGITEVASFFSVIQNEITEFAAKKDEINKRKKMLHYKLMRNKSAEMIKNCKDFFAILPAVRTDFGAIPMEGTDENYVDKWKKKQIEIIEKKCNKALAKRMISAVFGKSIQYGIHEDTI